MNIILTGVTGNLGAEIGRKLLSKNYGVVPVLSSQESLGKLKTSFNNLSSFKEVVFCDLVKDPLPSFVIKNASAIIHCAGIVHFHDAKDSNQRMMMNLIKHINNSDIQLSYASTAYLYKPNQEPFSNQYEEDKSKAEEILINSKVSSTIFRPSILTGHSRTGEIINFSGFYLALGAFIKALNSTNDVVRFPKLSGYVNLVPVDIAANVMVIVIIWVVLLMFIMMLVGF
ncbi:MAG: hypothetical protein CMI53_01005 [Parcubacteria group bacterium]|nr:hypothetical protein [Parcubacteria group bacterium]|tara:strand:- start:1179 stop:1862 length:684 start_codon:yes stop_codon:yes gene_type:complete